MSTTKIFKLQKFILIEALIELVKSRQDRNVSYDVYSATSNAFCPGEEVFVDRGVDVDDNDREIYPDRVVENKLKFAYSNEQFQDVIDHASRQKPDATSDEIIMALNHYSKYDCFIDL